MRSQADRNRPPRRRCRPGFEGLEARDLPASHPIGPALPGRHEPAADVQQFVPILYPPGTPQPTAAEVDRESFVNKAVGRYTLGPGRFSTQSLTIHGYGKNSTSNMMLHNRFQFFIFEPSDPTQPVTGVVSLLGESFLQDSATLNLDMQGPTGTEVDGLPTHLYWARDAASNNAFSGPGAALPAYNNFPANYFTSDGTLVGPLRQGLSPSSVANWNLGVGDVTLKFIPDAHPVAGSTGSGRVILVFRGLLNGSGVQNADDKNIQ